MTKEQAQYLLEALTFFELYPNTTEYSGKSRESIFSQIKALPGYEGKTDEEILKDETLRKFLGEVAREEAEIPKKTGDSETVPQELEELIEKSERREEELKAIREKAKIQTKERIERIEKTVEEDRKRKIIKLEPPQVIPSVEFDEKEKNDFEEIINRAKSSPRAFSEETTKVINKSLESAPEDISKVFTPETVEIVSTTFTNKLLEIGNQLDGAKKQGQELDKVAVPNPIWLFASAANPNDEGLAKIIPDDKERVDFAKKMQEIAIALESDYVTSRELLIPVFGKKITEATLGSPKPAKYRVSPEKEDSETINIGVSDIHDLYKTFSESPTFQSIFKGSKKVKDESLTLLLKSNSPWIAKPRGFISRLLVSNFFRSSILPTVGTIVGYQRGMVAAYLSTQGIPLLTGAAKVPLLSAISGSSTNIRYFFNISVGRTSIKMASFSTLGWKGKMAAFKFGERALGLIAGKSGQSVGVGIVTRKGFQAVTSQVFSKIGAALGSFAPIIGTIIGAIVGWLVGKILPKIIDWIKRHKEVVIGFVGAIFGFALGGIPGLIAGGAIALTAALVLAMGVPAATVQIGGVMKTGLLGVTGLVLSTISTPIIIAIISIPVIITIILFIINSGAYVVPPKPFSDFAFIGFPVECTTEKLPLSFSNTTGSPTAKRAWEITSDLYQGFWCSWNRSPGDFPDDITLYPPSYPDLFREDLFAKNPFPSVSELENIWNSLFWCTYLVQKSYGETINTITTDSGNSQLILEDFIRRNKYLPADEATPQNVISGSVVFFRGPRVPSRANHVGIVYSISQDNVVFIQANAPTKEGFITFNSSGTGLQDLPGFEVLGIGLP